ncbi:MAG: alpha-L-arabinofuranosidase C-terminal domain-containing protein [Bacteroidales bacterium]|nr:alpha-L-arabinofuranosidase C-terminal domain-containing protein [Bacteroidales bacterium]
MIKQKLAALLLLSGSLAINTVDTFADAPDSTYLFSYVSNKNGGRNGLHFAWSSDSKQWKEIGPEYRFVGSDYGPWGSEKRMLAPYLTKTADGLWHCVWSLNEKEGRLAHASSVDLINWKRQAYPKVMEEGNCLYPEISYNQTTKEFLLTWLIATGANDTVVYCTTTKDFKTYTPTKKATAAIRINNRTSLALADGSVTGVVTKVAKSEADRLKDARDLNEYRQQKYDERTESDAIRFAGLQPVEATITVDKNESKAISDLLVGVFFEDINYAADGGLYAELIQNRDFEYDPSDTQGRDRSWNSTKAWSLTGENGTFTIDTVAPIHPNNPHYAVLSVKEKNSAGLVNSGFDGIVLKKGDAYTISLFTRQKDGSRGKLVVRLVGKNGAVYGECKLPTLSSVWKQYKAVIKAGADATDASLVVVPQEVGTVALDMISLFPQKTYKNRPNGLRTDLAETLAAMHPRFVRFPGGCVAHGGGLENMYRWKNTIDSLESRKPLRNIWNYHQTAGLGYFEYFQFCEDIGAEPLPVLPAGVPCQNSPGGQQGGIPLCDMDEYVQEVLDLIEWANGDAKSTWGKKRAEAGHPKPFNLKYIGIGNEDLISDVFEERFEMIFKAVKEKHPEITVVGTVGPFYEGTDYEEGWDIASRLGVPMVDEHYYVSPGWMIYNQNYYDAYDRSKSKVYLGEYAAHLPGRPNNLETALAEALYLTSVERNGDVVSMASYAPLLAKEGHTQWNPDLIYFNNTEVKPTVDYYVQQLYGQNAGNEYLTSRIKLSDNREPVKNRIAASVVRDSKSGDVIIKLINMLPVSVKSTLNLEGLVSDASRTTKTILTGRPADKKLQPQVSEIKITSNYTYEMPGYSFTVFRITSK